MRVVIIVIAALTTLGLAAFGVVAAQRAGNPALPNSLISRVLAPGQSTGAAQPRGPVNDVAPAPVIKVSASTVVAPPATPPAAAAPAQARVAQNAAAPSGPAGSAVAAAAASAPPSAASSITACNKPGGMGLSRIVEIDTTGGPAFGFEHFKQYDFLRENEVVLTFDDGPWPENTPAVLKALADNCLKATFFEIGEHATWHPEITKEVIAAGNTRRQPHLVAQGLGEKPLCQRYRSRQGRDRNGRQRRAHAAADAPIAPFFRFPDLQQPPALLSYLGERNIATFSTDLDSFDFKLRRPEQVIQSVMTKLKKRGKGIVLMHDFQHATAEAMPELLHQLKEAGFKIVHMVPKQPLTTVPKYDEMVAQQDKLSVNNTRPENSVVRTISE